MYDGDRVNFGIYKIMLLLDFAVLFVNTKGRADLARPVSSNHCQSADIKSIRFDFRHYVFLSLLLFHKHSTDRLVWCERNTRASHQQNFTDIQDFKDSLKSEDDKNSNIQATSIATGKFKSFPA
jgi:hypothetical protein